jgi:hypothetical protein
MRFSLRKCVALSAGASLVFVCACEKHYVGELPELQKEPVNLNRGVETTPAAMSSPSPAARPTPAEFFPTKPR